MMLIGTPLYVCATASVPIAAALMAKGASPGAALAFLVAGPATNAATIAIVWKLLGRRSVAIYLLTIAFSAIGGGVLLDSWMPALEASSFGLPAHCHDVAPGSWFPTLSAILLLAVLAFSYARKPRANGNSAMQHASDEHESEPCEQISLIVSGMTCSHCAAAVSRTLKECSGVVDAIVDVSQGRAAVTGRHLNGEQLAAAVSALGYAARMER
jgi:uncharacterized protein